MDFQAIRKEYEDNGVDPDGLDASPLVQFETWFEEATKCCPEKWFETNAMTLATADSNGKVSARVVLLKGIVPEGIRFFTNYDSAKGQQLEANSQAAVVFHWPFVGRQVRISGKVEKTSRAVSEEYFHSRPRDAQVSAAVSAQSTEVASREELEKLTTNFKQRIGNSEVRLPENWGGYLLKPEEFEFWQGRSNRLHDRVLYQLQSGQSAQWKKTRLAP